VLRAPEVRPAERVARHAQGVKKRVDWTPALLDRCDGNCPKANGGGSHRRFRGGSSEFGFRNRTIGSERHVAAPGVRFRTTDRTIASGTEIRNYSASSVMRVLIRRRETRPRPIRRSCRARIPHIPEPAEWNHDARCRFAGRASRGCPANAPDRNAVRTRLSPHTRGSAPPPGAEPLDPDRPRRRCRRPRSSRRPRASGRGREPPRSRGPSPAAFGQ
jgi:hypothetical protein